MTRDIRIYLAAKAGALAPALRFVRTRWRLIAGIALVVVGIVGIAVPFASFFVAQPSDVVLSGAVGESSLASASLAEFGANRLLISEAGISMPLLTGEEGVLEQGAWITGSRPGEDGNTVIFGHRFKYLPPLTNTMFRLDKLEEGDTFTVRWEGRDRIYRVSSVRIVEPTAVEVAEDYGDERVTLITCTPIWSTAQRLVVVGFPVEE